MISNYFGIIKKFNTFKVVDKGLLFWLVISSILAYATWLSFPFLASMVVAHASNDDFSGAIYWGLAFTLMGFANVLTGHWYYSVYTKNSIYLNNALQKEILYKVAHFDEAFTKKISTANVVNTGFADIRQIGRFPDVILEMIMKLFGIIVSLIVLCRVNIWIGAIALVICPIYFYLLSRNTKKRDHYLAKQRKRQDAIASLIGQALDGNREISAFNMEDEIDDYLENSKELWRREYFKRRKYNDNIFVLVPTLFAVGRIIIYLVLINLILNGRYEIATLVLVMGYFENIQLGLDDLSNVLEVLSRNAVRVDRVYAILRYRTKNMSIFGAYGKDDILGRVEFKNISFKYEKQETMKNVSFKLEPHSFTAIVGKSGSGKSTIFRLLLRLYRPSEGKVFLDDKDIYSYDKEIYARNVSIVTQKPFIFDMSIRENLNFVNSRQEEQIEACKKAGIHNYIMGLPDGYNTKMIRDAENISGGQKQLLALARTLLSGAEVLLFDEVTSSLDAKSSLRVMTVIKKLQKDHTILMITHKPELMKMADEIMVIDHGRLMGKGKHHKLLKNNKYYQALQK